MIDQRELELADELLKLRGSSLEKLVKRIVDSIPERPLCISLKAMRFNERAEAAFREAEEHPERIKAYNSLEEMIKDSENW